MGDHFLPGLEGFKQAYAAAETADPDIGFTGHLSGINPGHNIQGLTGFPQDSPFVHRLPANSEHFSGLLIHDSRALVPPVNGRVILKESDQGDKKRKATGTSSPANSSPHSGIIVRRKSSGRGKRVKSNEMEEKPREVVHVRAKRGQATDSHSLAERVRREKINDRLRCLQDIVPGCYKTMGMAVMLDEIINYVQSLQNQVEFLSMKLTAASTFYDFNSETDALEAMQRAKAIEALKIQNGASPGLTSPNFAPLYLNLGCYPPLPHSR